MNPNEKEAFFSLLVSRDRKGLEKENEIYITFLKLCTVFYLTLCFKNRTQIFSKITI